MTTLAILTTDVTDYVDRADLDAKIPLFSKLARIRLERQYPRARLLELKNTQPVVNNVFQIPTDAISISQVSLISGNNTTILTRRDEKFVRSNVSSLKYYYRQQNLGYLGSNPAPSSIVEIDYFQQQPDLVNPADTNEWVLQAYDVIFWATIMQAALFLKDDEEIQIAQGQMQDAINSLELAEIAYTHSDNAAEPGDV